MPDEMTLFRLGQLRFLPIEAEMIQEEIDTFRHENRLLSERGYRVSDDASRRLWNVLQERRRFVENEIEYLRGWIEAVDDPLAKQAFRLRFIDRLEWESVAQEMRISSGACKMMCNRYIQRWNREAADKS